MADLTSRLALFFDAAADCWSSGTDMDGSHIQDLGVRLGLLVETTFNSEVHTDAEGVGASDGDQWFVIAPDVTSAIRKAQ